MRILLVLALIGILASTGYCLPLSIKGELATRYGDISVPGSISQECQYSNELRISRPFEVNLIKEFTLTPYIEGKTFNEEFLDDLILKIITLGCAIDINDNLTIGAERSIYDWGKNIDEETRSSGYLKVKF